MTIMSEDGKMFVDVGNTDIWICFYSTIITHLTHIKKDITLALKFIECGECNAKDCLDTARQLNLIRDNLSMLTIDKLVYDYKNPKKKLPWTNKVSPVVTSCGNFFTTADGKDLIFEVNAVLCYSSIKSKKVITQ